MAQTGSAQREPSMEEILASIRRIIEDSDSVRQPLEEPAELRVVSPAVEEQAPAMDEVQAFRAELDEAVEAVAEEVTEQVAEPAAPAVEAPVEPQAREMPQVQLSAEELTDVDVQKAVEAVSVPQAAAPQTQPFAAAASVSAPAGEATVSSPRPALLSETTQRQVSAAFGELSEAFAASRRRSFDEMAEEMLRPMLQEWLDNNLPTLVERLVREEIERVARGGQ
jgi:cell pole-organizing protein PopZ